MLLQSETTRRNWFSCTQQFSGRQVPRIGKSSSTKEMYSYDFYPSHCGEGSCIGMTREIVEQILESVSNTYYFYISGTWVRI